MSGFRKMPRRSQDLISHLSYIQKAMIKVQKLLLPLLIRQICYYFLQFFLDYISGIFVMENLEQKVKCRKKLPVMGSVEKQLLHESRMCCVYHPVISMARWGRNSRSRDCLKVRADCTYKLSCTHTFKKCADRKFNPIFFV